MPKLTVINPRVREVLKLLAAGVILSTVILVPGIAGFAVSLKESEREKWAKAKREWEKFNLWRLKQLIKRLKEQKVVEIEDDLVKITEKGRQKLLKFDLESIELKQKTDGKWRLIIYDIANLRKPQRELFRATLRKLKFLRIQKSVYLTPFICDEEIEYLRQIFNIGHEVQIIKVSGLENEWVYKNYFGI